jgi:hypothetical protein
LCRWPCGAWVGPCILHLPSSLSDGLPGTSRTERDIYHEHRATAYKSAGLAGVRDPRLGPSWADRIVNLLGCKTAEAVISRAKADVKSGLWGSKSSRMSYTVARERIEPVLGAVREQRILAHGPSTKIRMADDGSALVTHMIDGKLQSPKCSGPSALKVDAAGWIGGCSWHEDGVAVRLWTPAPGKTLEDLMDPLSLSAECRTLAEELMDQPGFEDLVVKLDLLWERAVTLAAADVESIRSTSSAARASSSIPWTTGPLKPSRTWTTQHR